MSLLHALSSCTIPPVGASQATLFCSALSCAFVGSLYCFVPAKIRPLHRDDARQIRWRSLAAGLVSAGSIVSYHWLSCKGESSPTTTTTQSSLPSTLYATGSVLLHTAILYLGPLVSKTVLVYDYIQKRDGAVSIRKMVSGFYASYMEPTVTSLFYPRSDSERWTCLRNLIVAPITEEIVFRACMVPVLEATGMTDWQVSFTAPLFFGFAHAHHAILKLQQGVSPTTVLLGTTFQFAYTSIFGAYVSYAYLRTQSLSAVTLCHSFCNGMGLPDLSFLSQYSPLFLYRRGLSVAMVTGLVGFGVGLVRFELPPSTATIVR